MNRINHNLIFIMFLFFSISILGQVEPLNKYDIINIDDYNGYSLYKLQGKKFYRYNSKTIKNKDVILYKYVFTKDKDTIYSIETEDITFFSIYKKRYLFVSYYPKEQKGLSVGFSLRRLSKVDVIDLKKPSNKWYFNLEKDKGVSLGGISDFKPNTGEIIFNYKFSIDTNNKSKSILIHKYDNKY